MRLCRMPLRGTTGDGGTITCGGSNAVAVVWPSTPTTSTLQQNTDLNTTNWVSVGVVPNHDGTNRSVIISPAAGNRFFRLKWP